ncbi:MAG: MFS transporter [Deltaproteobacteria bacterium]|jgi:MFS family permease|nr:MFS transporter [Deltaproteobacteria bacterium]
MKKHSFFSTAICIYLAYFLHGMQAIVISQHRDQFITQWNTDLAGVMSVIAWTGLAKFVSVWICGEISDRIGRRPMILIGAMGYVFFFGGLLFTRDYAVACACAFLAGAATSCLDAASYPALQESFPQSAGSALVLIKGFISVAGMTYPLLVGYLAASEFWTVAIWLPFAGSLLLLALSFLVPFSYDAALRLKRNNSGQAAKKADDKSGLAAEIAAAKARFVSQPKFHLEGVACLLYGFVSMMTFYLIQQVITIYGRDVILMSDMASRALMTYFTAGSLVAVILAACIMSKWVRTLAVLQCYTLGSLCSIALMYFVRAPEATCIAAFGVGFFAAGGAMQAGLAVLGEFFPNKKGRNLGIYYTFMGLAAYVGPIVCSQLLLYATAGLEPGSAAYAAAELEGKVRIILFDLLVAGLGFGLVSLMTLRYKPVFGISPFSLKNR